MCIIKSDYLSKSKWALIRENLHVLKYHANMAQPLPSSCDLPEVSRAAEQPQADSGLHYECKLGNYIVYVHYIHVYNIVYTRWIYFNLHWLHVYYYYYIVEVL